jgi:dCTP deaminase
MILSNQMILEKIAKGELFIGQGPHAPIDPATLILDTTSLNLHLSDEIYCWKKMKGVVINPCSEDFNFKQFAEANSVKESCQNGFIIEPGEFVLATTREYVKLPPDIAARVEGRSSLGRLGISIHVTAPTIHALFEGNITLEIFNHSKYNLNIQAGMKICQLIFESVDGEVKVMSERTFNKQLRPTG